MNALEQLLEARGIAILDGGLATCLAARGAGLDGELWSARTLVEHPDLVAQVHADYAHAGADIVTTATYQASIAGLVRHGLDARRAAAVLRDAGALARAAVGGPPPLLAGSLGSFGALRADGSEYTGDYGVDDDTLAAVHRDRLHLVATGVDLVACETVPSLAEGRVLARELRDAADALPPAWISFSVRDDAHCSHGEPIEDCVAAVVEHASVAAVGVNCFDPAWAETLVARIAAVTTRPIVVYPNSGERWADGAWHGPGHDAAAIAELVPRWVAAGARIVGGCCRTGPAWVAALHAWRGRGAHPFAGRS